jgi:hypothetical protein
MCATHGRTWISSAGQPVSKEFSGLGLAEAQASPYHCDEHAHVVKGPLWQLMWAGIGLAAIGVIVALASLLIGLLLILCGATAAVGGYFLTQQRAEAARAARPPLPLIPDLVSVNVLETLHGKICLSSNNGDYSSTVGRVEGRIDVQMEFTDPGPQLLSYRDRNRLTSDDGIDFSAGYVMISGQAGAVGAEDDLAFVLRSGPGATALPTGTGIAIGGKVSGNPLFSLGDGQPAEWNAQARYELLADHKPGVVPLWLVPSLMPDSNRRTLELDLQWVTIRNEGDGSGYGGRTLDLDRFELIELNVPAAWGKVVSCSEGAMIGSPSVLAESGESIRTIKWKRPKKEQGQNRQSRTLAIRFENEIKLYREDDDGRGEYHRITGRIQASFTEAFSGIKGVTIYRPMGDPWQKRHRPGSETGPEVRTKTGAQVDIKTEVSVDFDLSLRFIRYQDVWVVPDSTADATRAESAQYPVVPDHETVTALTSELSQSGYYVKRVIENPPRGGRRANLVNRYWDIAGYYYKRVFPIDFHITITGEEEYQGGIRAYAGNTAVQTTVQGSYVESDAAMHDGNEAGPDSGPDEESGADLDMKSQIERRWDLLSKLIGQRLDSLPHVAQPYAPAQEPGQPYRASSEPGHPADEDRSTWPYASAQETDRAYPAAPGPADENRATRLREKRDAITEALLAGRISEQTYLGIKEDIDRELRDL